MIVLDTDVMLALTRPGRHPEIVAWLDGQPRASVWTTTVNALELRATAFRLPEGRRREALAAAFEQLLSNVLEGRVLPFDLEAAGRSAALSAGHAPEGRAIATRDLQIAGIVTSRNATLATRERADLAALGIRLVDPWSS